MWFVTKAIKPEIGYNIQNGKRDKILNTSTAMEICYNFNEIKDNVKVKAKKKARRPFFNLLTSNMKRNLFSLKGRSAI